VILVVEPGWATTVQDHGRPGYAHLGVPCAGAVDRGLASLVNRLVGNDTTAAVLETAGGLVLHADTAVVVATSTQPAPLAMAAGERLEVVTDSERTWTYVALRGGIDAPRVLGSRSHDTLSGLGPRPPTAGQRLPLGPDPGTPLAADLAPVAPKRTVARVWPGPRLDWFDHDALDVLCAPTGWSVDAAVSRVGMRLGGPRLARSVEGELPSEGIVTGAVQVTNDGRPVVMLADHPTTGGYPVIAVVDPQDLADVAQSRPGTTVRFVPAR
jgi:biotin-dependent carboxylase-like uncharacterized protein